MSRKAKEDAFSKGIHLTAEKKIRFRNDNTSSQTDPAAGNRNYPILNSHQSVYILSLFEPFELIIFCFFQKIHSDQTVCPVCPIFDAGFQLPCLVNVIFFTLCSNLPKKNSFFQKRFLSVQNARRAVLNGWINVQSGFWSAQAKLLKYLFGYPFSEGMMDQRLFLLSPCRGLFGGIQSIRSRRLCPSPFLKEQEESETSLPVFLLFGLIRFAWNWQCICAALSADVYYFAFFHRFFCRNKFCTAQKEIQGECFFEKRTG